jgi:hypothetical protein
VEIWNLESKTHWMVQTNTKQYGSRLIGMTKSHLWTFMNDPNSEATLLNHRIVRFPLDGPPAK